jgi:RNA polymerase sigma factor (sigma-70 family)
MATEATDPAPDAQALREGLQAVRAAYLRLCEVYYSRLWRHALARVNGDPTTAEEIYNDVVMQGWKFLATFDGNNLLAWLFKIAERRALDWRRKQRRQPGNLGDAIDTLVDGRAAASVPPAQEDARREALRDYATRLQRFAIELERFRDQLDGARVVVEGYLTEQGVDLHAPKKGRPTKSLQLYSLLGQLRDNVVRGLEYLTAARSPGVEPRQSVDTEAPGES